MRRLILSLFFSVVQIYDLHIFTWKQFKVISVANLPSVVVISGAVNKKQERKIRPIIEAESS